MARNAPESAQTGEQGPPRADGSAGPETALWVALREAGPGGVTVGQLVRATGKGRTWIYERLRDYAEAGRVVQTIRGHWRASGHGDTDVTG